MTGELNQGRDRYRSVARHRRCGGGTPRRRRLRRGGRLFRQCGPAEEVVHRIEGKGGRALAAKADVSDAKAVRQMFDAAEAAFGGVDVLVNNAGIMMLSTIADSDDALFERQIGVNLKAPSTRCARPASGCAPAAGSSISRPASSG